jgi:hypothetical protein
VYGFAPPATLIRSVSQVRSCDLSRVIFSGLNATEGRQFEVDPSTRQML